MPIRVLLALTRVVGSEVVLSSVGISALVLVLAEASTAQEDQSHEHHMDYYTPFPCDTPLHTSAHKSNSCILVLYTLIYTSNSMPLQISSYTRP